MKIQLRIQTAEKTVLVSDEHAASSYGIPVVVVGGDAYGPEDILPIWPNDELSWLQEKAKTTVAAATIDMNKDGLLTEEQVEFLRKFSLQ